VDLHARRPVLLATLAVAAATGCAGIALAAGGPPRPTQQNKACRLPVKAPRLSTAAPSPALLNALAVLRRPRAAEDALPADALRMAPFLDGVMTDSARHVRTAGGSDLWIVPVEDLSAPLEVPEKCLRTLPAKQRKATREAIRRSRAEPPAEGVTVLRGAAAQLGQAWRTEDILAGHAFALQGCTGTLHDRLTLQGLVPDAVTQVTLRARGGALAPATPEQNVIELDQPRPDEPSGLPAHVTSTTAGAPLEFAFDPRVTRGLDRPCEPPSRQSIGQRREPPTPLDSPSGARIELQTSRWQPEDTGPQVAGATVVEGGRRCLLIASEQRLREGKSAHRFCVDDAKLRAERFIVHATRLASGDVVLEGFADRRQISWITVERSIRPGAFRLPVARGSGAFFVAIRGAHRNGGVFKLHAARRGAPVRYTGLRTVRLNPKA
jgi:hypothetical protein